MRYLQEKLSLYLNDLAAKKPAPGGGSAAALLGATGTSLLIMSANFTNGTRIAASMKRLKGIKASLEKLIDEDVKAYLKLKAALNTPRTDPRREGAVQKNLRQCAEIPLQVVSKTRDAMEEACLLRRIANKNLISDVECGAITLASAGAAAGLNIAANLKYIKDLKYATKIRRVYERNSDKIRLMLAKTVVDKG